jgi:2-hydroxy-6-oxonona-2,4-dienedioate hydrolase
MNGNLAATTATASDPAARFRRAEAAVWGAYGLHPAERFVQIARPELRLRLLEFGAGRPILLVHGTVGPAAWAPLVAAMGGGFRFYVLDRPGWGGSDALDFRRHPDYQALTADILAAVLDGLGIDTSAVIGGSIGDVWALSLADRHPSRVDEVALLGGGPLLAELRPPRFIRLLASPLGALIVHLPVNVARARSILVDSGHAASVADGRIPDAFIDYRVAVSNETPAMRNERAMVAHQVRGNGWRPDLVFDESSLRAITPRTLVVVGSQDNIGDPSTWQRFTETLPRGRFELIDGAGHMPWFDAPDQVANYVRRFLAADEPG